MWTVVVLFAALLSIGYAYPNNCNGGVKYWCKNIVTAAECGVIEFCKLRLPEFENKEKIHFETAIPVKIDLYYESFCPGCRAFILSQLYPTFQKLINTGIMEIGLYPYGNAQETRVGQKWVFSCQHGVEECQVNLVEACALHMLAHPTQFMPYIHCVESSPSLANAQSCATQLKFEWKPISNCYNGTEGNHLQHQIALKTNALNPPHQYVPWIVANGVHTDAIQESAQSDLLHFVCETYTGVKPHVCRVHQSKNKKCYKN